MDLDQEACYRAVKGRDRRFDGMFYTAVRTTGIYCRPSCPAITPRRGNVSFYRTAAGAQGAGYRACRRCLPDATPGLAGVGRRGRRGVPGDAAGRRRRRRARGRRGARQRAGLLDPPAQPRGHPGVRRRPARPGPVASRPDRPRADRDDRPHLHRHRVRGRVRQRAAVQRHRPRGVRRDARPTCATGPRSSAVDGHGPGTIRTRIAVREPFAADDAAPLPRDARRRGGRGDRSRVVRALGAAAARPRRRPARARRPHDRPGALHVHADRRPRPRPGHWSAPAACSTPTATRSPSTRRWPRTRRSRTLVADRPGLRVPGQLDGVEMAVQTVLGQQVSLASARTAAGRLVEEHGEPLGLEGDHAVTRLFPTVATLASHRPRDAADAAPHEAGR